MSFKDFSSSLGFSSVTTILVTKDFLVLAALAAPILKIKNNYYQFFALSKVIAYLEF
jgi:hypothetical protein